MEHSSGYIGALRAMSEFDQEQRLNGNWKIRRFAVQYFKRLWMSILDAIPKALRNNKHGNNSTYAAGVLLSKRKNGRVFVADVINVRENGADVHQLILNTVQSDTALYGIEIEKGT